MPSFMDIQVANEYDFPISLHTNDKPKSFDPITIPLPFPPSKKFLSNSLPNSATSSPKFASNLSKKKGKNQPSPLSNNPLARQHSVALANLERLKENHLRRSMSLGVERSRSSAPPEKSVLGLTKVNSVKHVEESKVSRVHKSSGGGEDKVESYEEKFKCGAMCLFIPGIGKAKQVKARREETGICDNMGDNVSRKVSLEKFECGSWTSSAIINSSEDEENESNLFFDLPMELVRCSVSDTHSSVTTAFVFDKEPKGVLKNTTAKITDRKSDESRRHVRFFTSSPDSDSPNSCVTPRLHKAREDFNAFLEAQCA
uniref:Protein PHYTOCHROME KINASE SUBSTRATE 1-like n=1 Tax=Nicotiana tabacum TaxID=4097 RepID=A0A1S4B5Y7_TOBAC|nr:PREDICTED: uncharacterized protein LOC107804856 [Nicotiana tabacum]